MDRVQQGTSVTIAHTFTVDGVAADPTPDSATIEILRGDGTELVPAGTNATNAGPGKFTYTLTPTQTAQLDLLTVKWTATFGQLQTMTSRVEIVGGFLFTVAEARALKPLGNAEMYPLAALLTARTLAEQTLEEVCNVAFVPRYRRERAIPVRHGHVRVKGRDIRAIRDLTVDDVALTVDELAAITVPREFTIAGVSKTGSRYVIGYEHGHDFPPEQARRIALRLAKRYLVETPIDERASSMTTDDGTISLVTPGLRGMLFDIPEANAFVQVYGRAGAGMLPV